MVDLKRVYRAASLGEAELALDALESTWGDKYPVVIK
jgi:putative transposase